MLTSAELTAMRTTTTTTLPETMAVIQRTLAADTLGGLTASWSAPVTVSARIAPADSASGERVDAGADRSIDHWKITLPALTPLETTDRITFGSRTFEVLNIDAPRTYELWTVAHCLEVT